MEVTNMGKIYIKYPSEAPNGANVKRGIRGGYYYDNISIEPKRDNYNTKEYLNDIIAAGDDHGYVKDDVYVNMDGEKFRRGDEIEMYFMGQPNEMPKPWKLINAKNHTSYMDNYVDIEVQAANGKKMKFDHAHYYSPHKP